MNLAQAFRLLPDPGHPPSVALVGSGGKTTALFQLARCLNALDQRPVIVSATAHLHVDQIRLADSHLTGEKAADFARLEEGLDGVVLVTGPVGGDRTTGLDQPAVHWLHDFCQAHGLPLLIEADGSRQRPLKAPADSPASSAWDEPPIPDFVDLVVVVTGLSGLGQPISGEYVHRPEIFARLAGQAMGTTISPAALVRVLIHSSGGLKNIPSHARRLALLNQAGTPELQAQAKWMAADLLAAFHSVVIASLNQSQVHAVYEPVAGIILAGGEARRFGQPKQLLEFRGQPFVRAVAQTALASRLSPVVVVTGANADAVEAALHNLPITVARNPNWQTGQSSSIKAGLQAVERLSSQRLAPETSSLTVSQETAGAAIFLLADQPQVTSTVIQALTEKHAQSLVPILAPLVDGQRANPVLFDCVTFPDLSSLSGDVGGRAIFSKHVVDYLPWQDESLLLDVDTPEDLQKLKMQE